MASFSVVSNLSATNAQANLIGTSLGLNRTITRLSSGLRINMSGDDAAGLAVANTYRSQQAVLTQGVRNANDGLSTLQIKDGALNNISTLVDRLATLATQSASSSSQVDRAVIDAEFQDVLAEIDREASVAGMTAVEGFSVFISADGANGTVGGSIAAADTTALGLTGLSADTAANAAAAVTALATAVGTLGTTQSSVGTLENRLQYAESRIRDANIAEESANLARYSILTQSGIAALAQANSQSGSVLSLLR
jgi:flagellin